MTRFWPQYKSRYNSDMPEIPSSSYNEDTTKIDLMAQDLWDKNNNWQGSHQHMLETVKKTESSASLPAGRGEKGYLFESMWEVTGCLDHNIIPEEWPAVQFSTELWFSETLCRFISCEVAIYFKCCFLPRRMAFTLSWWCPIQLLWSTSFTVRLWNSRSHTLDLMKEEAKLTISFVLMVLDP